LKETYNSLGVPIGATVFIQAMKEVTASLVGLTLAREMGVYRLRLLWLELSTV